MARPVERSEIVDYETYRDRRPAERERIHAIKAPRRIHVGDVLTFLFENTDTIRYQVQEMMLAEQIVKESAIQHELDTYNQLLGGRGALGCSLLIEIDDEPRRRENLRRWLDLPRRLYVRCEDGTLVRATYDPAQVGAERLSAVQYLKFDTGGRVPVAVGCDLPELAGETRLTPEQVQALRADLDS
jgi:uncharacterized protein DUF3501